MAVMDSRLSDAPYFVYNADVEQVGQEGSSKLVETRSQASSWRLLCALWCLVAMVWEL